MKRNAFLGSVIAALITATALTVGCGGGAGPNPDPPSSGSGGPPPAASMTGVLMWKGDTSGKGLYSSEATLTPANVNVNQFGRLGSFLADGLIFAQPLFVRGVDTGGGQMRDLVIIATEHDSIYALDANNMGAGSVWERHYVDAAAGVATLPDNFGGRTTLGGEVGITGTPYIDTATGALYFVTILTRNGVAEQWLRAIDIRSGQDFGPGSALIQASVPGDGVGSSNGQIAFDPAIQNQRAGLMKVGNSILAGWGSFSDFGVYHGWLMAFDAGTLQLQAVFNPTMQFQANDPVSGPSDHGGGGSFWQAGAPPSIDDAGNIFVVAADGSFNADQGGNNYGDTVLKLRLNGGAFQVIDWFTPSNQACVDEADLEIGSGGVAQLPSSAAGRALLAVINKEGRLYLIDPANMGKFNAGGDQIPQQFMIGADTCTTGLGGGFAEGSNWNRLYGNVSFWNGNIYAGASNMSLRQYSFQNGSLATNPVAQSPSAYGLRGGNSVVSANGNQNAIVWVYEKAASGQAILHAYDANQISTEFWNSNMNASRDSLGTGIGFGTPVVVDGKVFVTSDKVVTMYGLQ
jgi:hypothetical protein